MYAGECTLFCGSVGVVAVVSLFVEVSVHVLDVLVAVGVLVPVGVVVMMGMHI